MSTEKNRIEALAEAIRALTYSEMMEVGQSLADANSGDGLDTDVASDWAAALAAWAENKREDPTHD